MADSNITKLSKFLSLILRHKPEKFGLEMDRHGWVSTDELLRAANKAGKQIDQSLLERIVPENDKQRFAFNEDKSKIRAVQGHSRYIDLGLNPRKPPQHLYHGTVERFIPAIKEKGLIKGGRQYVHLSPDTKTATAVGSRRGQPVILTIESGKMYRDGYKFFLAENGVWLAEYVPPQYIEFG